MLKNVVRSGRKLSLFPLCSLKLQGNTTAEKVTVTSQGGNSKNVSLLIFKHRHLDHVLLPHLFARQLPNWPNVWQSAESARNTKPPLYFPNIVPSSWIRVHGLKKKYLSFTYMTYINISSMVSSSQSNGLIEFNQLLHEEHSQAPVFKCVSRWQYVGMEISMRRRELMGAYWSDMTRVMWQSRDTHNQPFKSTTMSLNLRHQCTVGKCTCVCVCVSVLMNSVTIWIDSVSVLTTNLHLHVLWQSWALWSVSSALICLI